jgi:hypothetical protein
VKGLVHNLHSSEFLSLMRRTCFEGPRQLEHSAGGAFESSVDICSSI